MTFHKVLPEQCQLLRLLTGVDNKVHIFTDIFLRSKERKLRNFALSAIKKIPMSLRCGN